MTIEIEKSLFQDLARDILNTNMFIIDEKESQFVPKAFDNLYIVLDSKKGIKIIFVRDRGDTYCMLGFGNHNYDIENIYKILGLKNPNLPLRDFLLMTQYASKSIAENIGLIVEAFSENNAHNTIKKLNSIVESNRKIALDKLKK